MKLIAEIGSNHNQSKQRISDLIYAAKECGFDFVKFQKFKPEKLWYEKEKQDMVREHELSDELFFHAIYECSKNQIGLGCTPFDNESLDSVYQYCDFLKISSLDILRSEFIDSVLEKNMLTFISLGMALFGNVDYLVEKAKNKSVVFMHCISKYPAEPKVCNIRTISYLKSKYNFDNIGYSDHSVSEGVIFSAINHGAKFFELHFDLDDMMGRESSYGHCWSEAAAKHLIKNINDYSDSLNESRYQIDKNLFADPVDGMRPMKELR